VGVRFPSLERRSFGVGFDLPWGAPIGFLPTPAGDRIAPRVRRFLDRHAGRFSHVFASWQPCGRNALDLADYAPAWDSLFADLPGFPARALHHTALNLGAPRGDDRTRLFEFTNALVARYGLGWVNEDLGLWSLAGKPLPYPLPPYLTEAGLAAAVGNVAECQRALTVPLLVEFPGFSEGVSLTLGRLDAYEFFRAVVVETDSPATLDLGHLLSWRWLKGHRGEALYDGLDRLPLAHCFEIHLSGCELRGPAFHDAHHGVLLPEQLELLRRLLPICPNLKAITYEDPRFDDDGTLLPETRPGFEALAEIVAAWTR
jgi:uncharacterized protein (UPF0276 family)